jgi:hypothetical protein
MTCSALPPIPMASKRARIHIGESDTRQLSYEVAQLVKLFGKAVAHRAGGYSFLATVPSPWTSTRRPVLVIRSWAEVCQTTFKHRGNLISFGLLSSKHQRKCTRDNLLVLAWLVSDCRSKRHIGGYDDLTANIIEWNVVDGRSQYQRYK